MNRSQSRRLRLTACAIATFVVFGCGGGSGTTPTASTTSESVQAVDTLSKVTVTASGIASNGTPTAVSQWSAMQFAFNATIHPASGADQAVAGTLLLRGEAEDGATEVEGRLLVGTTPPAPTTPATTAVDNGAAQAALASFRTQAEALRTTFRNDVHALIDNFKADLAAADATQRTAVKQAFADAFKALNEKFQQDLALLVATLRDQLTAAGVAPGTLGHGAQRHGDDNARGAFKVNGVIGSDGAVTLTIGVGNGQTVQATGKTAADGGMSGTFTGPGSGDTGTWSATASNTPVPTPTPIPVPAPNPASSPSPSPSPAPVGNAANGATSYAANCANCHGADPKANLLNVARTTTVSALDSAISGVGSMRSLANALSAQDKLDLVAFIGGK